MGLEKRDATRLITFDPPLPRRGFAITDAGSTTSATTFGGGGQDGRTYGRYTVDTSQWSGVDEAGAPPVSPGERFQLYTWNGGNHGFYPSGGIPFYHGASPDLQRIDLMLGNDTGVTQSPSPPWTQKNSTLRTVLGTKQVSTNAWDIYFTPYLQENIDFSNDGIITFPEPRNGVWLGSLAYEQDLTYSYTIPGGPDTLGFNLMLDPRSRTQALNPGRIIQAFRGASCIWEGIVQEPQPSSTGWAVTANGAGSYGQNYGALYTVWNADEPINEAINRGLSWNNDGIGKPAGIYLQTPQDTGSFTIQDFLNQLCTGGALYWTLDPPDGASIPARPWTIRLRAFPNDLDGNPLIATVSAPEQYSVNEWQRIDLKAKLPRLPPDLYIVNATPVPRTVANDYNTLLMKYQVTADTQAAGITKAAAATFDTIVVDNPASVALHGRSESYLDISSAGTMTAAQVIAVGQQVLQRYVRANYSQPFTVQPGQLLNNGGVPVDLGCNWTGRVATVQVQDGSFGGEVSFAPITFLIGSYVYDDTSQTATLTPYQSQFTDLQSTLSALFPGKFA